MPIDFDSHPLTAMQPPLLNQSKARLKAVLIDHDGTLVDSEVVHAKHWRTILESYGRQMSLEEFQQRHAGRSTRVNAAAIVERYALQVGADELAARKEEADADFLAKSPFPLMPGAREAITALKAVGVELAIVTAGGADAARATAAKHFPPGTFAGIVTGEDVLRTKPFPDAYHLAMKQLDVSSNECIAIEDTSTGMQAALAAGTRCVVVRQDSSHAGNAFVGASHVASSLLEAAHWALTESLYLSPFCEGVVAQPRRG